MSHSEVLTRLIVEVVRVADVNISVTSMSRSVGLDVELAAEVGIHVVCVIFALHEVRKQIIPTPARIAESDPSIIISSATSCPAHTLRGRRVSNCFIRKKEMKETLKICVRWLSL